MIIIGNPANRNPRILLCAACVQFVCRERTPPQWDWGEAAHKLHTMGAFCPIARCYRSESMQLPARGESRRAEEEQHFS